LKVQGSWFRIGVEGLEFTVQDSGSWSGVALVEREREFFIDSLLVRIHFIIEMIWWTGLTPWEFGFPFPGSLISSFLGSRQSGCWSTPASWLRV